MLNEIKPYFFYSQYNSIRMVEVVEWDNYSKPKTVENTLSYQEDGVNAKDFYQLYQFNDAIRNQFKSSYSNHEINIHGCDGSVNTITPIKRTDNLGILDYRTAKKIEVDGVLVVYFGAGDILEENTDQVLETYNLYQAVPSWMKSGKKIEVDGFGELEIYKTIWLSDQKVYGLKMNVDYSSAEILETKVKSIYNAFDFNVFEFDVFFNGFDEGIYQIEIIATDDDFDTITYLSERIYLKDFHKNTHQIISMHDRNNQINYAWGIQHMIRVEYLKALKYSPDGENTIHKTDDNTILLGATTYENYEAELKPVPTGMAIKINMLLALRTLFLDTRPYTSESKASTEKLGSSNVYQLKPKLILSNDEFQDKSINFIGTISNVSLLKDSDVILIKDFDGYITI